MLLTNKQTHTQKEVEKCRCHYGWLIDHSFQVVKEEHVLLSSFLGAIFNYFELLGIVFLLLFFVGSNFLHSIHTTYYIHTCTTFEVVPCQCGSQIVENVKCMLTVLVNAITVCQQNTCTAKEKWEEATTNQYEINQPTNQPTTTMYERSVYD